MSGRARGGEGGTSRPRLTQSSHRRTAPSHRRTAHEARSTKHYCATRRSRLAVIVVADNVTGMRAQLPVASLP